jgi:hypothetical protein
VRALAAPLIAALALPALLASAAGATTADTAIYRTSRPGFYIALRVKDQRFITYLHVKAVMHCESGRRAVTNAESAALPGIRIDPETGRFQTGSQASGDRLVGTAHPRLITGQYHAAEDLDGDRCATGSASDPWVRFRARLQ